MIDSGRYASVDELVEAALQRTADRERDLHRLNDQIRIGLDEANRGELLDGEAVFAEILGKAYAGPQSKPRKRK